MTRGRFIIAAAVVAALASATATCLFAISFRRGLYYRPYDLLNDGAPVGVKACAFSGGFRLEWTSVPYHLSALRTVGSSTTRGTAIVGGPTTRVFTLYRIVMWPGGKSLGYELRIRGEVVIFATAILPLSVATAAYRRRRHGRGCARCGYDLRGTPDRCPECGLVPAAAGR